MKNIFKFYFALIVASVIFLSSCASNKLLGQRAPDVSINYQTFYDDLSPYGTWIDYPSYGQVWHPNVNGNFRPYLTNGSWDYSDAGWMWMSNYNWGWAPFHYGRWVYDDSYGWLWVPGYDWSPAWVTWGMFDNNYCWAPLMPGINIGISYGSYRPHSFYWNAVPRGHIYDRDIDRREIGREQINNRINNITVINNFSTTKVHNQYYSKGPDVKEVEKYTSRNIKPASIAERNNAGPAKRQGDQLQVYRPSVHTPQPKQFRRTDNEHVNPLINNQDHSLRGNERRFNNNANQGNLPAINKESQVTEPERNTENQVRPSARRNNERQETAPARNNQIRETAPARINENQSRPMNRVEAPIRNNETEQKQNLERLPMYRTPVATYGNRASGGGRRRY